MPLKLAPWTENKLHYRFESERFNKAKEKLQDERETSLLLKLSLKEKLQENFKIRKDKRKLVMRKERECTHQQ